MNYRQLGKTGIKVSEIGFGTWGLGGDKDGSKAYGPTDDCQSEAALHRAFELGITFYDTADFYGFGHSESLLGKTFKEKRSHVIIAGKVGFVDIKGSQDFSPDYIRRSLTGSLQRLGTDYIDVYQLHSPPIELVGSPDRNSKKAGPHSRCGHKNGWTGLSRTTAGKNYRISQPEFSETIGVMQKLQKEGLIRSWGVSLKSPDDGLVLLKSCSVGCVQINFNLTDQRALQNGLFDLCSEMGIGVIIRTPLCFGFLTGEYADKNKLAESDHRRQWSHEQIKSWHKAPQLFESVLKKRRNQTRSQLALRFCLSYKAVSTVIPGMLTSAQVEENAQAGRMGALTPEELTEIQSIYAAHDFFLH